MFTFITMGICFSGLIFLFVKHFEGIKRVKTLQEQRKAKPYRIMYQESTKLFFVEEAIIFPPVYHAQPYLFWTERIHNESRSICESWIAYRIKEQQPKVEVWP